MWNRERGRWAFWGAASVLAVALLGVTGAGTATAGRTIAAAAPAPLDTAVFDPLDIVPPNSTTALARVKEAGATYVRLLVDWDHVAPDPKPSGFNATNPDATGYHWSKIDTLVTQANADSLTPILDVVGAPTWATSAGTHAIPYVRPSPAEFGRFAQALATRYDGNHHGLPRVTYFQAWNEPNKVENLAPQQPGATPIAPAWYRQMVNAFARGVHRAHADNMVIAGSLAPYAAVAGTNGIPPLTFMKEFLCSTGRQIRPRPSCLQRAHFDIWSMQPYTWGSPVHKATVAGDIALGDLPAMKSALDQAWASGQIVSSDQPPFWATEFSYDTNPPDSGAIPLALATRWTAESLYRMWKAGISLVTWFLVRDQPASTPWQSGLWKTGADPTDWSQDTKKSTFESFRFPVVAFPESGRTRVWAHVPPGGGLTVTFKSGSTVLGVLPAVNGIATGLLASLPSSASVTGVLLSGETSNAFSLTDSPDCPGPSYCPVNPFGN